jgi:uncharacterized membrane protein YgcG
MKRLKFFSAIAATCFLLLAPQAFAQNVQDFSFESFDADYYLDKNGENDSIMRIDETLIANFPNIDQNHGILRAIPESYKNHTLSLSGISVKNETGVPYQFSTSDQNGNKVLKIGNPNQYAHGRTIYKISYRVQDVTSYYPDHDELFWDINGDQWDQSFASVTARIHLSKQLLGSLQDKRLCYSGTFASAAQTCSITLVTPPNQEAYVAVSANTLGPRQTLSAVLAFKPGTFNQKSTAIKKQQHDKKIELISSAVLGVIPPIFAVIFMFRRWRQFGNDPKGRGIIIPEYEPPKGFNVLNSDFLLQQKLRNQAFSAALIDLAVKGYITIIEIPKKGLFGSKDYELKLNKTPGESVSPQELTSLKIIFGEVLAASTSIKISDFKKDTSKQRQLYKEMKSLEKSLASDLTSKGYFIKNPKDVKSGYQVWASVIFFACFFLAWFATAFHSVQLGAFIGGISLAAATTFIFSFIMPARTEAGVTAHDALLGLKDYIKLAEADRLKFLQSPEGAEKISVVDEFNPKSAEAKVKLFEKLLPYAMLFKLEKDWAKQFNDLYTNPPDWYQGGNWTAFNAGYLAGSLSDFNNAANVSFASPSSSSGSGFSGGGAGGGGGGGGGGGW